MKTILKVKTADGYEPVYLSGLGDIVTLTGYTKPAQASGVSATDSVNAAIGKLEKTSDTIITSLNDKAVVQRWNLTATATGWTGAQAPYTQSIAAAGMLATDIPEMDIDLSGVSYAQVEATTAEYSKIYRIASAAGALVLYANDIPSVDLALQVMVTK